MIGSHRAGGRRRGEYNLHLDRGFLLLLLLFLFAHFIIIAVAILLLLESARTLTRRLSLLPRGFSLLLAATLLISILVLILVLVVLGFPFPFSFAIVLARGFVGRRRRGCRRLCGPRSKEGRDRRGC